MLGVFFHLKDSLRISLTALAWVNIVGGGVGWAEVLGWMFEGGKVGSCECNNWGKRVLGGAFLRGVLERVGGSWGKCVFGGTFLRGVPGRVDGSCVLLGDRVVS